MKYVIAMICIAAFVGIASATDGYHFRNGYYYYGSEPQAYYRTLISTPGYWSYGRYYVGYSYYSYSAYTPQVVQQQSYSTTDWKTQLLKIAEQRDKYQAKAASDYLDQQNYLQAIKALGLEGNFRWPGYGTIPGSVMPQAIGQEYGVEGHYYNYQSPLFGANASTVYGYNQAAKLYNDDYLPGLFQMANQQTINSQALTDKAQTGFAELVGKEGQNKLRIAEIIAKGQMVASIMKSLEGPPSAIQQGFEFRITPKGFEVNNDKVDPALKQQFQTQLKNTVNKSCAECHSAKVKKGGVDMTQYHTFSAEQKAVVLQRITSQDPSKRMPLSAKGPGEPLPPEIVRLFAIN